MVKRTYNRPININAQAGKFLQGAMVIRGPGNRLIHFWRARWAFTVAFQEAPVEGKTEKSVSGGNSMVKFWSAVMDVTDSVWVWYILLAWYR